MPSSLTWQVMVVAVATILLLLANAARSSSAVSLRSAFSTPRDPKAEAEAEANPEVWNSEPSPHVPFELQAPPESPSTGAQTGLLAGLARMGRFGAQERAAPHERKAMEVPGDEPVVFGDCLPTGPCELCLEAELGQPYCRATRRREEYVCHEIDPSNASIKDLEGMYPSPDPGAVPHGHSGTRRIMMFKACTRTPQDEMRAVLWFELCMAICGGLAMYGVSRQKNVNPTLYDRRLHRRVPSRHDRFEP